jgi:hypothetical protein
VARGPGFHLKLQEVEEIGSDRPEKECVVSDDERNGRSSCSFGFDHKENVSETAEIGFVYDQECVGVVHAYVDQKLFKSGKIKSFNRRPKHRV